MILCNLSAILRLWMHTRLTTTEDPRAKQTCLGKHVEPCHRFHQALHFIGKIIYLSSVT